MKSRTTNHPFASWVLAILVVAALLELATPHAGVQASTPASGATGEFEFSGLVEKIAPEFIVVRGVTTAIDENTKFLGVRPEVGSLADIQANIDVGRLVATIVFGRQPEASTTSTLAAGATEAGPTSYTATSTGGSTGTTDWVGPGQVTSGVAARPSLAFTADGVLNAAFQVDDRIFVVRQNRFTGVWSEQEFIAYGWAPVLAARGNELVVGFVASLFGGESEIYYVSSSQTGNWSLPENVSHTERRSVDPRLAIGADGTVHVTWADFSPGYWTIYYGWQAAGGAWSESTDVAAAALAAFKAKRAVAEAAGQDWSNRPVPSGRGEAPDIAVWLNGEIQISWLDAREIWYIASSDGGDTWALPPAQISDGAAKATGGPGMAVTADGYVHAVWTESTVVKYVRGRGSYWPWPATVSTATSPSGAVVVVEGTGLITAWGEDGIVRYSRSESAPMSWGPTGAFIPGMGMLSDVALASSHRGVAMAWTYDPGEGGSTSTWGVWPATIKIDKWSYLPLVVR